MTEMVLKPCPFCGREDSAEGPTQEGAIALTHFKSPAGGTVMRVACCCGSTGKASRDYDDAIAAWNTRAAPSSPVGEGVREKVARIIDPAAFADWKEADFATLTPAATKALGKAVHDAYALADAILALLSTPPSGWQPIETAPKDGTMVLIADARDGYVCEARHLDEGRGWWARNNDPTDYWGEEIFPTHWMPLPQPPALLPTGEAKE